MLMYVSSLNYKDKKIIQGISDNASRINSITGDGLCYLYFVDGKYAMKDRGSMYYYHHWAKENNIKIDLFNAGYDATINIADDICKHFGIFHSELPAFILISRRDRQLKGVFSINCYEDLELFLTPINIIKEYIDDRRYIIKRYDSNKRRFERIFKEIEDRRLHRESLQRGISRLKQRKNRALSLGLEDEANNFDHKINKLIYQLEKHPEIVCNENIGDLHRKFLDDIEFIEIKSSEKLNRALSIHNGKRLINLLGSDINKRNDIVLSIWNQIRTKTIRISKKVQTIREKIQEIGFDVFISCKSQDYESAHEVKDYLERNGYKPFLADSSLQEIGVSEFSAVIGEVLNQCKYLIVFATEAEYLETPYVHKEWLSFFDSTISGRKPNAQIFTILAPTIKYNHLPYWLGGYQSFTIDNYKEGLINYLRHW